MNLFFRYLRMCPVPFLWVAETDLPNADIRALIVSFFGIRITRFRRSWRVDKPNKTAPKKSPNQKSI